jgi:tetratricopeptide (TPR) repeat protein
MEKNYLASEEYYKKSIEGLKSLGDTKIKEMKDKNNYPLYWFLNDLGHLYFDWARYDEAIEQYNKVIDEDPKNGYAQIFSGLAYYQKGNFAKAKRDFEDTLNEFNARIENILVLKDLKESIDDFIKAPKKNALAELCSKLNKISKQNESEELIKFKEILNKLSEEINNPRSQEWITFIKASSVMYIKFQDSLTHLKLEKASILTNLGRIEIETRNYDRAEKRFKESKEIYEGLMTYLNKPPRIAKEFENLSALHNNLGILYYKQDRLNDAIKEFAEATDYSESARAYNNLGNAYYKKNDTVNATENYLKALNIDPEQKEAKNNLNQLRDAKEKTSNWWEWWFDGKSLPKRFAGGALIALLALVIISAFVPFENALANYSLANHGINLETNTSFERTVSYTTPLISISPLITSGVNRSAVTIVATNTDLVTNNTMITRTDKTSETNPTKTETTKETMKREISPETKLLFAALVLFALIHPQIKGFSAGSVKFDLEPMTATKGAASPQCAG